MSHVVLGLLFAIGPQTIYSLNKLFEAGVSLFYAASLGALRQALQRLLAEGHVTFSEERDGGRIKKVYTLTGSGEEAFLAWMRGPVVERDLEVAALSKLYFLGALPDREDRRLALEGIVRRATEDEARLVAVAAAVADAVAGGGIPEEHRDLARYQQKTLEYGLRAHGLGREFFSELLAAELGDAGGSPRSFPRFP